MTRVVEVSPEAKKRDYSCEFVKDEEGRDVRERRGAEWLDIAVSEARYCSMEIIVSTVDRYT
jgi:hypothetical protein